MSERLPTTCPRDCPDACAVLATVEQGRVTRLQGDPSHPVTQGFLCERTSRFVARQNSAERLTHPLLRKGAGFEPIDWDQALDLCAQNLLRIRDESGPASILYYRSGGSLGILKQVTDLVFDQFGPVTTVRGSVCSGAGEAAQELDFGLSDSNDFHDLLNAKAILLWGKNPFTSSPHLIPLLRQARAQGTAIALIDPVKHRAASLCDLVIQPRPGGDWALAFGLARILFERGWTDPNAPSYCDHFEAYQQLVFCKSTEQWAELAGVSLQELVLLSDLYGGHKPASILVGWGMQRRTDGGAIVRALDALGTVSGNMGVSGGGVSFYFRRRGAFDLSCFRTGRTSPRTICEPTLGKDILQAKEPPIRAAWITCGNPVIMLPDSHTTIEALKSIEFLVVADSFLTDTAKQASLVLPTCTFLEDDDLVGAYGHHYLGSVRPVVPALPSTQTDFQIAQKLAPRLGLGDLIQGTPRQWKQKVLGKIELSSFEKAPMRSPNSPKITFEGQRFLTPNGRANLIHELPEPQEPPPPDYPLALMALSTPPSQCSQWSPSEPDEPLWAKVHPASAPGLSQGQRAYVCSALGKLAVKVEFDESLRPDIVVVPKGGTLEKGRCANALTAAVLTDLGEGGALYQEPVRLEAIE